MGNDLARLFTASAARRLQQYLERIESCVGLLNEEQVWARGSGNENAIGNLMLHLAGNVRQWIICGVGGAEDRRDRDAEFAARGEIGKAEMVAKLKGTVEEAVAVIEAQSAESLEVHVKIQGYTVSKLEAVFHVVEHFALHTGQVIFATKEMTHQDMGFYRHLAKGVAPAHEETTP